MDYGEHRGTYPVATDYITFKYFFDLIVEALGQSETTEVPVVTYQAFKDTMEGIDAQAKANGKEHGIHMTISTKLRDLQLRLDEDLVLNTLGVPQEDMEEVIKETLEKCVQATKQ